MRQAGYAVMPVTYIVKRLLIINLVLWFFGVLIVQNYFLSEPYLFRWFGFVPVRFFQDFFLWQPVTYMFLHTTNVFHVLFNMLLLWWLGAELESYWGRRYFLIYYMSCGVGAALLYLIFSFAYYIATGDISPVTSPVVGASGAIFGLILAYGLLFGERIIYFLGMFPMKARIFVIIIGSVELLNLVSSGFSSRVANLAHLGGIVTGIILLKVVPTSLDFVRRRQKAANGRKLKLVVNNPGVKSDKGPRYWN